MFIREACVDHIDDALLAEKAGADQIEWCGHLEEDGLTPDYDETVRLLNQINIPVKVMIRHRPGNFIYEAEDQKILMRQAKQFIELKGVSGLVFGACTSDLRLDIPLIGRMISISGDKTLTIHKAIDTCADIRKEIKQLNLLAGNLFVLTSGGQPTAWEGRLMLRTMQDVFCGKIIAAGKIDADNLVTLHDFLSLEYYHGKKIVRF